MSINQSSSNMLGVQDICGFIVCKVCQISLPSEKKAKRHLCEDHKVDKDLAERFADAAEKASKLALQKEHPVRTKYQKAPEPVSGPEHSFSPFYAPLCGLKIYTGYQCTLCSCCFSSEIGMRTHIDRRHSGHALSREEQWRKCETQGTIDIQTLRRGKNTKFFPVTVSKRVGIVHTPPSSQLACPSQETNRNVLNEEKATLEGEPAKKESLEIVCEDKHADVAVFQEMDKALNSFHGEEGAKSSRMNVFVARTKVDVHLREANITMADAAMYAALRGTDSERENLVIKDVKNYLLRVETIVPDLAPAVLHDINLRGVKEFTTVSKKAVERYARNFARIVLCAMRTAFLNLLPDVAKAHLNSYVEALARATETGGNARLEILHLLLKSLCLQRLEKMESPRHLFVWHFVMFASVVNSSRSQKESFRFTHARDISPLLAALLYGASSVAISDIYRLGKQSEHFKRNEAAMEDGNNLSENNKVLETILCALDESQNSAPSFIRKMLSTANMISKQDDVDFIFDTCEAHPLCGIVDNVHIGMKKLGEVVKNLHQQIDLDMSNILYGSPFPPKFSSNIAALEDVIQEKNPGFSFLSYGPNKIRSEKYALWLFKQITEVQTTGKSDFSAPEKAAKFEVVQAFGKNIRRGAVQRWLTKAQNIQEKLLACMHLSSGSPGRATEFETLQLFNSEYNLRNFYVCQGRSLIVTRYSKVRSIAGWDRIIPRFPDPGTSKRFLSYLLLFRTLESVFVRSLYGVSAMKSHMQGLFVERGTSYVACRIRDEIRKIFHAHGIPIEFNQFRHFVTGMVPVIVKGCSEVLKEQFIEDASSIAHLQAGHSVEVAEHVYARKPSDIPTLPTTAVAKYRMFSTEWHKSMRLVESVQADKPLSPSALSKENVRSILNIITSISSRVSDNLREALSDTNGSDLKKKRIEHPTQPSQLSRRQLRQFLRDPPARNFEQLLTKYLPTLRSFFNSDKVMFRSAMQLDVTVSVCEAEKT